MTSAVKTTGSIRGFNRASTAVTSIKLPTGEKTGYKFECFGCGTEKKFKDEFFVNPHGAAIESLNRHHCS